MATARNLKAKVLQGGVYLTLRQLFGIGLSMVSILVIARILGPEQYGIVAVTMGIFYFTIWTSKFGLNVYLVRQPDLSEDTSSHVLAFYNTLGLAFCLFFGLAAPAFGAWTGHDEIASIVRILPIPIWMELISSVSISMMDRELRFAQIGMVETAGQFANYLVAVPLVLMQWGYWGSIVGLVTQFVVLAVLARYLYPIRWRWRWEFKTLKPALSYGATYSCADWIMNLRGLTIPVLVSHLAGLEAAGIISISIRFVEQLSVLRLVIRRMSIGVLARLMGEPDQVRSAISRGMAYQALLVGAICASFGCLATLTIPMLFGEKWLPSVYLFPLVALATLIAVVFDLHTSALYTAGHNREVAFANFWLIGILWLVAWILLPRWGYWGYGVAELAAVPAYFLLHRSLTKLCGSPNYRNAFLLVLAATPALLAGPWIAPVYSVGLLLGSYSLLFLLDSQVRKVPMELYGAWRSR